MFSNICICFVVLNCVYSSFAENEEYSEENELDGLDFQAINKIQMECASEWGLSNYYDIEKEDLEDNIPVRCTAECEYRRRKFLSDKGELLIGKVSSEYRLEYDYNNRSARISNIVLENCYREYSNLGNDKKCYRTFHFVSCLRKQRLYHENLNDIRNCFLAWMGKLTKDFTEDYDGDEDYKCYSGNSYCFTHLTEHIMDYGIKELRPLAETTGFLKSQESELENLLIGLKNCKTPSKGNGKSCRSDIEIHACVVTHFQKVFQFFVNI